MRWLLVLTVMLLSHTAYAKQSEPCIAVSENNVKELRSEYGMTTVEWSAHVNNVCDDSYDGTLTVRFLDEKGEVLHESLEIVILEQRASENTSRRITLPAEDYGKFARIDVTVEERKRPT